MYNRVLATVINISRVGVVPTVVIPQLEALEYLVRCMYVIMSIMAWRVAYYSTCLIKYGNTRTEHMPHEYDSGDVCRGGVTAALDNKNFFTISWSAFSKEGSFRRVLCFK